MVPNGSPPKPSARAALRRRPVVARATHLDGARGLFATPFGGGGGDGPSRDGSGRRAAAMTPMMTSKSADSGSCY
eukprot:7381228-Prymnesium_polylepis.1